MATRKRPERATKGRLEREKEAKERVAKAKAKAKAKQERVARRPERERKKGERGRQRKTTITKEKTAKRLTVRRTRREKSPIETIQMMTMINCLSTTTTHVEPM